MLLVHCPNCEHDNTPGERFCAVCGVPLDLRPCPRCGKVDQITAKVCTGCGEAFPPIILDQRDDAAIGPTPAVARADERRTPLQENMPPQPAAPATRALPLVIIAIAAGGIPLLWMNRAYIPLPKTWQIKAPSTTDNVPAPMPVAPATPVVAPEAARTELPMKSAESAAPARDLPPSAPVAAQPARKESPKRRSAPTMHPRTDKPAAAVAKTAAARPCTEALAALNLCDPKAGQK